MTDRRHIELGRGNGESPIRIPLWFLKGVIGAALIVFGASVSWAAWVTRGVFTVAQMAEDISEIKRMVFKLIGE